MSDPRYRSIMTLIVLAAMGTRWLLDRKYPIRGEADSLGNVFAFAAFAGGSIMGLQLYGYSILPMNLGFYANHAARSVGLFLGFIAAILILWSRLMRLKTWAHPDIAPHEIHGHFLATGGPYRFIRHPFYAGVMIGALALELSVASYLALIFPALLFVAYRPRALKEESRLNAHYGDVYREYQTRTWRFFPFIY